MAHDEESAAQYAFAKASPIKQWAEEPTFLGAAGDLCDRSVLDLACGSGHYSRLLKRAGAAQVVGVDVSRDMIAAARAEEARQPLGIEYRIGDVAELGRVGSFDIVSAAYLFVYAATRDALQAMCRKVAVNLASSGRLVAATLNPDFDFAAQLDFERTGILVERVDPRDPRDGAAVHVRIGSEAGVYEVRDYLWSRAAYEGCMRQAGLVLEWHPVTLVADGGRQLGDAFWDEFLRNPTIAILTARAG